MGNNLSLPTYTFPLILQSQNCVLRGGLCLSQINVQQLIATHRDFLHPKEQDYLATLLYPKRQYSYLLGRYCAKQAISAYKNLNNSTQVLIETGVFHQPIVSYLSHDNIQVSISHTDILGAALAFPEAHPMGIDVEAICPSKVATIKTQLSPNEQQLAFLFSDNKAVQLTFLWTVKEALSKVLKCGLMVPFELLEVEKIKYQENFAISYFKNFKQYKALSFFLDTAVCSLVYPQKTYLALDIRAIQKILGRLLT
ncbi:4'-phosphopantetheinyl transferase family protein [Candidatus Paracaedibacter symbiosus]|uniref:4'-phosphopantetheinyl transferase family protein n=1 Tax=Candidatus Paracaedibacter symbiosus TaxID=244582 RepID=UPI00068D47E7|nr:4'-phosphopantetheinyl transferase superfamily protein [Candidatus Paracaedibacter symbiosus]